MRASNNNTDVYTLSGEYTCRAINFVAEKKKKIQGLVNVRAGGVCTAAHTCEYTQSACAQNQCLSLSLFVFF